jgi:hypothetical protein
MSPFPQALNDIDVSAREEYSSLSVKGVMVEDDDCKEDSGGSNSWLALPTVLFPFLPACLPAYLPRSHGSPLS